MFVLETLVQKLNWKNILGIDKVHYLKEITQAIIKNVDEDIKSLKFAHDELRKVMKVLCPKEKFVVIAFLDGNGNGNGSEWNEA